MTKRTLFKLEVFEDFTVDSFFAIPAISSSDKLHLATVKGETLKIKTISQSGGYLMELYRISLFPNARKELLDNIESGNTEVKK